MNNYKKLINQPLTFVLAEFRFSPIYTIDEFIPKIQKDLRKDYPNDRPRKEQSVQVQPGGISVSSSDSWAFISTNSKSAIDISNNRLVYMTTEYPRFEGFAEICKSTLKIFADIVDPGLITRIGLRYGDSITIKDDQKVTDFVNPEFDVPKSVEPLGSIVQHTTHTYLKTTLGGLLVRSQWANTNMTTLPDLQGVPISIAIDPIPSERMILDFDHFWEANDDAVSFDEEHIMKTLSELHQTSREAFWKTTTDKARDELWS